MLELKRIIYILFIIFCICGIIGFFIYKNNYNNDEKNVIKEYIPQEEISDEQIRQTVVSLYFKDEKGLIPEARLIDVKILINNPYEEILNLLIKGPKNEKLKNTIPKNTKINKIEKNGEILIIDFSNEFVENHEGGEIEERNTIQSIVNTVTELTEINGVKIIINGEENKSFKDEKIKFNKIFYRE